MKKLIYLFIGLFITLSSCNTQTYYVDNVYPQARTNQNTLVTSNWFFYPNSLMWNHPFYDPFVSLYWSPMWGWNNIYLNRWIYPHYSITLYPPRYTVAPRPSRTVTPSRYERRSESSLPNQPRAVQPSRTRTENYNRVTQTPPRVERYEHRSEGIPMNSPRNVNPRPSRSYTPSSPSRNYNQSTPSRSYNQPVPSRNNSTPSRSYTPSSTPSRRSGNN
jgi:hypothetical protein